VDFVGSSENIEVAISMLDLGASFGFAAKPKVLETCPVLWVWLDRRALRWFPCSSADNGGTVTEAG